MNGYFDNGSTSFPKPRAVADAISNYLLSNGGTYGRAAYGRVMEATRGVEQCRDLLAEELGVACVEHLFFTSGATAAINTFIKGSKLRNTKVLVSPLEHNAVMRSLEMLKQTAGVEVEVLPHFPDGTVDVERFSERLFENASLVIINHQSNVNGVVQPIEEIVKAAYGVPVMVDGSQAVGYHRLKVDEWGVEAYCFTCHKGLLGPTGLGGFYVRQPQLIDPLLYGGTGSHSDSFDMPTLYPDRMQAGTPNMVGIIGLGAALSNKPEKRIGASERDDLIRRIEKMGQYRVYCCSTNESRGMVFSIIHSGLTPSELSGVLYQKHGIETRSGLHCAPLAHQTLGTFPGGTTRIALSPYYHTTEDLDWLVEVLGSIK